MRSLTTGATGMLAQQLNVEVISNNIANMNTTGFKRQRAEFQDLLYQDLRRVGSDSSLNNTIVPTGVQVGVGVRTSAVYRIHEQGSMISTDNQLDIAIRGKGFFQVELPNGDTAYSRAGSFQINADGTIVTADGYTVQPQITVPQDALNITINNAGQVSVQLPAQVDPQVVGQLQLAVFPNDAGLESIGDNLLLETPASGAAAAGNPEADGFGSILQGYLEGSNVNSVQEITSLITAQRAYELNSKVIETSDEMMQTVSQLR